MYVVYPDKQEKERPIECIERVLHPFNFAFYGETDNNNWELG